MAVGADQVSELGSTPEEHSTPQEQLLDAAERLLITVGYAHITTRRLATEAGVNHGLVHYYFGSNDNLLVQALERFTERLIARQRDLYASDLPFVEKWRTAMRFLTNEDFGYEKIWFELQALGWNDPDLRERLGRVNGEWRAVLTTAFEAPHRELRIPIPLDALVALVITFNMGVIVERLGGIDAGHQELLAWIDRWLSTQP
jgi:AcrR family transcriptional regulator